MESGRKEVKGGLSGDGRRDPDMMGVEKTRETVGNGTQDRRTSGFIYAARHNFCHLPEKSNPLHHATRFPATYNAAKLRVHAFIHSVLYIVETRKQTGRKNVHRATSIRFRIIKFMQSRGEI